MTRKRLSRAEWFLWYNRYLRSEAWRSRRAKVLKRANGICEKCQKNRAVQVHHLTYDRVGRERLSDLQALCATCHNKTHGRKTLADYISF